MAIRPKTGFEESLQMNNFTWRQYYNRLMELSMVMFEWKGLPDTVDPRFLELTLFRNGSAIFFKDDVMGYLTLASANYGTFNVYNVPKERRAFASNGYQMNCTDKDSVIIWNNYLRQNSRLDVEMFAKRLYNIDRIIDVNANAQKTPLLIVCDENERLTFLNLYKKYDGNEPVIKGSKGINYDNFKVLKTDAPYVCDKMYDLKTQIWNEALTYLGISNVSNVKKERMITDEVTRNLGGTIASRYSKLLARQQACEQINAVFGLDISCEYREDFEVVPDDTVSESEDDNNE